MKEENKFLDSLAKALEEEYKKSFPVKEGGDEIPYIALGLRPIAFFAKTNRGYDLLYVDERISCLEFIKKKVIALEKEFNTICKVSPRCFDGVR